jgi:hypothetical protein
MNRSDELKEIVLGKEMGHRISNEENVALRHNIEKVTLSAAGYRLSQRLTFASQVESNVEEFAFVRRCNGEFEMNYPAGYSFDRCRIIHDIAN